MESFTSALLGKLQSALTHGRNVEEIRDMIGADALIFQDLDDLIETVGQDNPAIAQFDCSVFDGRYVTRDVDQDYLDYLDALRKDDAKALLCQSEAENLELHNEG